MMTFIAKLGRYMKIISRQISVDTCVNNAFCEFADEGKERDRTEILEEFIVKLQRF